MTDTKRERILDRLLVLMQGLSPAPAFVDRNRVADLGESQVPAVVLYDGGETYAGRRPLGRAPVMVTMSPAIRWVAVDAGDSGAAVGGRLSSLLGQIQRAVVTDATLAGLLGAEGGLVSAKLEDDLTPQGGTALGEFVLQLEIQYLLDFSDPWED